MSELALGLSVLTGAMSVAVYYYANGHKVSPDGMFYLDMGRGNPVAQPYRLRVLLPFILRDRERWWKAVTVLSLIASCPLIATYAAQHGVNPVGQIFAAVLWAGLPLNETSARFPVLVDPAAIALALGCAVALNSGMIYVATLIGVLAALTKEATPVFIALFAWSLVPLCLLIIPLAVHLYVKTGEAPQWAREYLDDPFASARKAHRPLSLSQMVLPWGACLAAVFSVVTVQLAATVAVAYGQLVRSNDKVRLYQWAAPVAIVSAVSVLPEWSYLPLAVAHIFNPFRVVV